MRKDSFLFESVFFDFSCFLCDMLRKFVGIILLSVLMSCENNQMKEEVQAYCECLQKNMGNDFGRMECIEMMDSLQSKYKNQPRMLEEIRKETLTCN
jgi:hypothetical protein